MTFRVTFRMLALLRWSILTYISRSLSQRNNAFFQSKEQWHPAEDPINTWHSSSIGRELDRQSRGSGFGFQECHIYRVTVWLKSSTVKRGKRMLTLLRWSTINPRTAVVWATFGWPVGGGRMTPQRTRKLRKIATSGKRRSIDRGKFYKKSLDHFWSSQIWGHRG